MPSDILFDVRCLQDPNYASRGVGRHALTLLQHAPRDAGWRCIGLQDPALPALPPATVGLLDALHPNTYAASFGDVRCFISLSPMTHDALFAARFISGHDVVRAAAVYDFIPNDEPDRYLSDAATRLRYRIALAWLARFDRFGPISRDAADGLQRLLGIPESAIAVTGAPLHPAFEAASAAAAGNAAHVLIAGGGDPRKNVECVVRAHAASARLQQARVPLLITGNYSDEHLQALNTIAAEAGGQPALLRVTGHIPMATLVALYRNALCVVMPSRAEGFSLPVIEGMASGVATFASDIPAHRELIEDAALRFGPDDVAALAGVLEKAHADPAWRAAVVARQANTWPRYRAAEVARRFWAPILPRLRRHPAPAVARRSKPRVALLSPLPPDRSGVADYTAATCGEFGHLVDLHVFSETTRPLPLPGANSVQPLSALPQVLPGFDRVVGVIGNSAFHTRIFALLRRFGGACIAHDSRMLTFYRSLLGMERARAVAGCELHRPVAAHEIDAWIVDEGRLEALLLGEIAESATPTILHSLVTARMFQERYAVAPVHLPFSVYRPLSADVLAGRSEARARLGLPDAEVVIVTFGFVHPVKAPEECIWALQMLRSWGVPASLHFVGDSDNAPNKAVLEALVAQLGLGDRVRFLGAYSTEATYQDYRVGADLAIQLRTYGLGQISGALIDCIAAGLPTVTNASLAEAIGAPDYVRQVPDRISPVLLAEALVGMLDVGFAATRPEAARAAFCEERSLRRYAQGLCRALALDCAA